MHDEPSYWRYFFWLNLFVFSMLLLVMGDNILLMFFGWEGVGLCSYGLIAFWYTDLDKAKAGMKAFIVNRVGDFGFVIGLFILFWALAGVWGDVPGAHPTIDFMELKEQIAHGGVGAHLKTMTLWGMPIAGLIGLFLFIGATGKSAQIPLYVWLPDAMAGPTPVSALIHAATMVTAGVYMVARMNFVYALSPEAMTLVTGVGALTAIFAASIGFFQYDIKKVLAYSTVSQLGFMFIGVGVGAYWVGMFHLVTHAFFKACLFLGSGSVIMGCHHEQDMRKMGGLKKYMPATHWTYLVACIAIAGFPVASGFYSKDEILWKAFNAESLMWPWMGTAIWAVGSIAALGTAFYMFRSYYMTFTGEYRGGHGHGDEHGHGHEPKESPKSMTVVLQILAVGSVAVALIGLPHAWGLPNWIEHFLEESTPGGEWVAFTAYPHHTLEWLFQLLGGALVPAAGWLTARWLYKDAKNPLPEKLKESWKRTWTVVYNKYYVDELYQATVIRLTMWTMAVSNWFDKYIIDGLVNLAGAVTRGFAFIDGAIDKYIVDGAVNLVAGATIEAGRNLRRVQTGQIQTYLYGALGGALVFVAINYLLR
jgi:NADH-quinone oxidoreductase subunit L